MKTIIGFFSRPHGFDVLNSLVTSCNYKLLQVYTHKLNPRSQDPTRSIRHDYHLFERICELHKIPLFAIDSKNYQFNNFPDCDFIIEVSWRYMIPLDIIKKARIASFGIHRGKLPQYAGAEPIKQALKNHEKKIVLSAHDLNAPIDKGKVFDSIVYPVDYDSLCSIDENVQNIRDQITPLFSKLALRTLTLFDMKEI